MPDQIAVWEKIAKEWQKYRTQPKEEVKKFLSNKKGLILDLGCANGRNFLKVSGTIVGMDFSENMLRFAKARKLDGGLVRGNATAIPFADNTFDAILLSNTLPSIRVNRHRQVLKEIVRVSKDGANIFISVWNKDQPRFADQDKETSIQWGKMSRYYYLYSKDELKALMSKFFTNVRVFGSSDLAFGKYPKNIIATARVRK